MAEKIVSPGVFTQENDLSQITEGPIVAGAAIVGPTVKGPVEEPTIVTSYSDYKSKFGSTFTENNNAYSYLTSIAAYNYFQQGGDTLLVTRVVSGSFTSANSTQIPNGGLTGSINLGNDALLGSITTQPSSSTSLGTIIASSSTEGNSLNGVTASITFNDSGTAVTAITVTNDASSGFYVGQNLIFPSESLKADTALGEDLTITINQGDLLTTSSFILKTIAKGENQNSGNDSGSLIETTNGVNPSGSVDNVRWEISNVDANTGLFNLLVRRGNDSRAEKVILETWNNLSLDPFDDNYIKKVIGDQYKTVIGEGTDKYLQINGFYPNNSRYIYVDSITNETPNYLDSSGTRTSEAYTASLPLISSGNFHDATGKLNYGSSFVSSYYDKATSATLTQGVRADNYTQSLQILGNTDLYNYNLICFPGITTQQGGVSSTVITTAITNAEERGDHLVIFDTSNYDSQLNAVANRTDAYNSNYAATYWPWGQVIDPDTGQRVFVPASTAVIGAYAFNDKLGETWTAPAGINRGLLGNVIRTEKTLTKADRDTLYDARINPLATFAGSGIVVFGQRTLQKASSALDRINVRRLLISLKQEIGSIGRTLVFENNTTATRNNFVSRATAYLESVQQKQGVYAFKVVMDDSNNTPSVIDRNQLVGQVFVQPTKTAEFVILDFTLLPTGAEFPE